MVLPQLPFASTWPRGTRYLNCPATALDAKSDGCKTPGARLRFPDLLSRLDDESLQTLIGEAPLRLLLQLEPGLASPSKLRELAVRLHSPQGLLLAPESRRVLFDVLPKAQAELLATLLGIPGEEPLFQSLKKLPISKGSRRERVMFDFFGLSAPSNEDGEEEPARKSKGGAYQLFHHQRDAVKKVKSALEQPPRRVLLHMPTGAGKTRTAMNVIASHLREREPTLVVWLANSEELCEQAASEFEQAWSYLGNRKVEVVRYWGSRSIDVDKVRDGFLVGSLAKFYRAAQREIGFILQVAGLTSLVIIDEAHSAVAETYRLILNALVETHLPNPALLGLTATPGRTWSDIDADEELANFFNRKKVSLSVEGYSNPVDFLVEEGYLASVDFRPLLHSGGSELTEQDIRALQQHFDVPERLLERLADDDLRNMAIVNSTEDLTKRHRRILVFAATVDHANVLAAILELRGHNASAVTASTPAGVRRELIADFRDDSADIKILCNYGVLTTGFDAPKTSAALIARPTNSLVLYSQMVGRAIRGPRAGGNATAEVVTVVDQELPGFRNVAEAFSNWEDVWE
jgi:DNA repair protein RadD